MPNIWDRSCQMKYFVWYSTLNVYKNYCNVVCILYYVYWNSCFVFRKPLTEVKVWREKSVWKWKQIHVSTNKIIQYTIFFKVKQSTSTSQLLSYKFYCYENFILVGLNFFFSLSGTWSKSCSIIGYSDLVMLDTFTVFKLTMYFLNGFGNDRWIRDGQ